ncbi:MAG TPA: hypothetical protein VNZ53_53170, partial [Steroidobacteraceae bacterium]|nr:hypothetical protein [Steroidobacteraceae bacterium]
SGFEPSCELINEFYWGKCTDVRFGSNASVSCRPQYVRSTPNSRHFRTRSALRICADFVAEVVDRNGEVTWSICRTGLFSAVLYEAMRHCPVDPDIGIA